MSLGESDPQRGQKRQLLKEQLRLRKRKTPEGQDRWEIVPVQESLSFEKGFFLFIRAVQTLAQENEGVVLVGLAGPSGAGKTVFSEKVISFMPGISLISMDNYNVASRVIDGNFDDPRITDYDLLLENIESLRRGEPAEVPIYDFKSSSRVGFKTVAVPKSRVVIVEGIYALSERLRPMLDLRVSITGGVHFDLVKRVLRDIDRSGQPPEEIIAQISETVYPMYKAFIEPDLQTAHLRITNSFNPFSGFQNATYILKAPADMGDEEVKAALSEKHTMNREETYDIYLLPPGEDKETCVSYLRMRNRDGRYSLMFEEWVTDGPFVITPRITFEVSVRLLGGLMALGYEMAHIIKRESRVFKDPESRVTVKLDHLEQLSRDYVQVQGKDRAKVKEVAEALGMKGKYIAKAYIEQILLEDLTKEVEASKAPKNFLKDRFRLDEGLLTVSPGETLVTPRTSQASSWNDNRGFVTLMKERSHGFKVPEQGTDMGNHLIASPGSPALEGLGATASDRGPGRTSHDHSRMRSAPRNTNEMNGAQLQGILERLDELLTRMDGIETQVASMTKPNNNTLAHKQNGSSTGTAATAALAAGTASPASASALSNELSSALQNGTHSVAIGALPSRSQSANAGQGMGHLDLTAGGFSGRHAGSLDLPPGAAGQGVHSGAAMYDFLEEVRMLAKNQSRMADQLESLNNVLRLSLEWQSGGLLGSNLGNGRSPSSSSSSTSSSTLWRLQAIMSGSALVSLACASALVFTLFRSGGGSST